MTAENLKIIKDALYKIAREENEAIERAIASSPKPPESLYQRCDEMVDELLKKQKRCLPIKKAITILIASAILISVFAITAYALRDKIGGFFVDFFEKYAKLSTDEIDNTPISLSDISITYIPQGFIKNREKILASSALYEWSKNDYLISIHAAHIKNTSHSIDIEDSNYITVTVGDLTVFRTDKYGQIGVTWTDGKIIYTLTATGVTWDEMVKIIEGIKIEE